MQLSFERPDYQYALRSAGAAGARVNARWLTTSFAIAPDTLIEDWPVDSAATMQVADLDALLALAPELILLGTGPTQMFPPAAVLAACLQRGIGIEVMANDAAARTYAILAGEGRRVVAGFLFPPEHPPFR